MNTSTQERIRPDGLADWLLAHGRSSVTTDEAAALMGISSDLVRVRLHSRSGEFVSPARGLWVPIAPEYRLWGAPEGIELVDRMMRHLGVDYYVGWLSAAAIHGAAHHAPQTFQVATQRPVTDREVGRTSFRFLTRRSSMDLPAIQHPTREGTARVSTPEITALDVAADIAFAGGIDNAATVLLGLAEEQLDLTVLAQWSSRFPASALRRIGWILQQFSDLDTTPLLAAVRHDITTLAPLDPTRPNRGASDERWLVRVNSDIDPEF